MQTLYGLIPSNLGDTSVQVAGRRNRLTLATKSVKQNFDPSHEILSLLESFRSMTNDCVRIGLNFEEQNKRTPSMKKLSLLCYKQLERYGGYSSYRLTAISKAAGILSARAKSIRRGFPTKRPYLRKPLLVSCYGFKVQRGNLIIHLDASRFESIPLSPHTLSILSDRTVKVRSFVLTENSLSLCVSKDVRTTGEDELTCTVGVDRNLRNVTVGNTKSVTFYDMSMTVEIGKTTHSIVSSFRRNDCRIRRQIFSKYGRRRSERIKRILHVVSKDIVRNAKSEKAAIVFEDIRNIRRLYRRGNGQACSFRAKMNSAPWLELKRQVEYKAAWEGVPVITLTRGETMGTSVSCPKCGERLQSAAKDDWEHRRMLWCQECRRWLDRDLVAALNISKRGWLRFGHSKTQEGEAEEAVKGNPTTPVILRVDASKFRGRK